MTFRLGNREQLSLDFPGVDLAQEVISEVIECFELFEKEQDDALRRRISDIAYYRNFIGLAWKIAPDGDAVRMVGLTANNGDRQKRLVLATPRRNRPRVTEAPQDLEVRITEPVNVVDAPEVSVRGTLRFADSVQEQNQIIRVIEDSGVVHVVRVPQGMMRDIVRPMYEDEVVVTGRKVGEEIRFESIDRAESRQG